MLDAMISSKFAIIVEYENLHSFLFNSNFSLMDALGSVDICQGVFIIIRNKVHSTKKKIKKLSIVVV